MINEFLDPHSVSFKEVDRSMIKDFVEKHYLGKYPAAAKIYVGIFYNNVLVGMVIYGSPIAPSITRAIFNDDSNVSFQEVMELKRVFLTDDENLLPADAKRNLAGYSISNGNKIVEQKFPDVKVIVTYSDSKHHSGSVYKATNAVYQGESNGKKRWVYPVGSSSQKNWVKKHLRTNQDWKSINECFHLLQQMWKDII